MEKNLKDYLPFHLGCEMMYATHHEPQSKTYTLKIESLAEALHFGDIPILRPLSDMTEEEKIESGKLYKHLSPNYEQFRWLLSKSFDLFGLIDAGLAIDKIKV